MYIMVFHVYPRVGIMLAWFLEILAIMDFYMYMSWLVQDRKSFLVGQSEYQSL